MIVEARTLPIDPARLAGGYQPLSGVFDEMLTPDGLLRPHWDGFINGLSGLAGEDLARRIDAARQLIHENGITYNVYGDPEGLDRPWKLDTVPLLIPPEEWATIERGLIQRAHLLNRILADVYGQQMLIREGHLPASLVFANPRFLRPCHGIRPPGGAFLHVYAVDLGRSPDGRWWVLNDRAQAPSGAGYALENRIVESRVLPDLIHNARVERLAAFFRDLRESLRARLPHRDDPRIVLLTPGPFNETYFEHVYLARYLGLTLVEGADLTVRDDAVFLRTLTGLQQVDVILRRLDDDFCDPLELRDDSSLGVAGLVQAYRAGNVVIANALGSGVVECQGLMGFLPGLCRHFFGDDLILPNIATWWCGQPQAREFVLDNLERLVIRPTFATGSIVTESGGAVAGADLDSAAREALRARIRHRGYAYLGQESVTLSTVPILTEGRMTPVPMTLRAFVAAAGDGYIVMPGGLTRFSVSSDTRSVSMQRGDGSKDTWVLSSGQVSSFSLLTPSDAPVPLRRSGQDLPSRAADNLFWLGRYAERAESVMRLLRALLSRLSGDIGPLDRRSELNRLLRVLVTEGAAPARLRQPRGGRNAPLDPRYTQGLRNSLSQLQRTASLVRERLSLDAWRILNRLFQDTQWQHPSFGAEMGYAQTRLDEMIYLMAAFSGMAQENMTRGVGWTFLDIGRRVERALHGSLLLKVLLKSRQPNEDGTLELLLELADSFMTYRSRYLTPPRLPQVVDLLLADESNPRAIAFQLATLDRHAALLPRDGTLPGLAAEQRIMRALLTQVQLADIETLCRPNPRGVRVELEALLTRLEDDLPEFSETIGRTYFTHAKAVRFDRPAGRAGRAEKP
ncbi:MAG: circularly permuted type 2 ATP-grasp protein [Alphaproteobacteria bacterium]